MLAFRLLLAAVLLLAPAAFAFWQLPVVTRVLGPTRVDQAHFSQQLATNTAMDHYVDVRGSAVFASGIRYVSTTDGVEHVDVSYQLLAVGNRLVIVSTKGGAQITAKRFRGVVRELPADLRSKVLENLKAQGVESMLLQGAILDATEDFRLSASLLVGGLATSVLVGLCVAVMALRGRKRLSSTVVRTLSLHPLGVDAAMASVNLDLADPVAKAGPLTVGREWLSRRTVREIDIRTVDELVWVYAKQRVTRDHKLFSLELYFGNGRTWTVNLTGASASEQSRTATLLAIQNTLPWVVLGWRADIEEFWARDRPQFVRMVAESRQRSNTRAADRPSGADTNGVVSDGATADDGPRLAQRDLQPAARS